MQVSTLFKPQDSVDNSFAPGSGPSSFPNNPKARINKVALAIITALSVALLAAGVYFSVQALVVLGSISNPSCAPKSRLNIAELDQVKG